MTAFDIDQQSRVVGVKAINMATGAEESYRGPVILATGHSARDVYRYLAASGIEIEPKGIAVGVRLEHPSQLIDQIQYHSRQGRGKYLPAAEYSFVTQVNGRGVYSFCMCPASMAFSLMSWEITRSTHQSVIGVCIDFLAPIELVEIVKSSSV